MSLLLASVLAGLSRDSALVVAGDFNLTPGDLRDDASLAWLLDQTGLQDAASAARSAARRIDKVLFRSAAPGGVQLPVAHYRVEDGRFRTHDGRPLSDHDPVAVTFWLGPA